MHNPKFLTEQELRDSEELTNDPTIQSMFVNTHEGAKTLRILKALPDTIETVKTFHFALKELIANPTETTLNYAKNILSKYERGY